MIFSTTLCGAEAAASLLLGGANATDTSADLVAGGSDPVPGCLTWYTFAVYDWKWYSQTEVGRQARRQGGWVGRQAGRQAYRRGSGCRGGWNS